MIPTFSLHRLPFATDPRNYEPYQSAKTPAARHQFRKTRRLGRSLALVGLRTTTNSLVHQTYQSLCTACQHRSASSFEWRARYLRITPLTALDNPGVSAYRNAQLINGAARVQNASSMAGLNFLNFILASA